MEFCDGSDLYQKIVEHKKRGAYFKEAEIWNVVIQLLRGLDALHSMNIYHRDLKVVFHLQLSANVFLTSQGLVKLGDMNVSKLAKKGLLYTQTGTPYYASPEVWKDQPYDHKSDIWSLGCVIYEMATLKPPFRAEDKEGLYKKVLLGEFKQIPELFSKELGELIGQMLQVNPSKRPDASRL
jgi:NIMA (never in mitosis gene a)-related kinase